NPTPARRQGPARSGRRARRCPAARARNCPRSRRGRRRTGNPPRRHLPSDRAVGGSGGRSGGGGRDRRRSRRPGTEGRREGAGETYATAWLPLFPTLAGLDERRPRFLQIEEPIGATGRRGGSDARGEVGARPKARERRAARQTGAATGQVTEGIRKRLRYSGSVAARGW